MQDRSSTTREWERTRREHLQVAPGPLSVYPVRPLLLDYDPELMCTYRCHVGMAFRVIGGPDHRVGHRRAAAHLSPGSKGDPGEREDAVQCPGQDPPRQGAVGILQLLSDVRKAVGLPPPPEEVSLGREATRGPSK
jgi:hypothetical protein